MIVIFLIGIIGSVIGYNMKGSLEEGKAFKTERAIEQMTDILSLAIAQGSDPEAVKADPATYLKRSGLVKNPDSLTKDGWGIPLNIAYDATQGELHVTSERLQEHRDKKKN